MKPVYVYSLFAGVMLSFPVWGKSENPDLVKARYLYNHLAFHDAIPLYEKAAGMQNDAQTYAALADCYRLTRQTEKAADNYRKAVSASNPDPMVRMHYAQVLMNLQRYTEAADQLKLYLQQAPNERRAQNMLQATGMAPARIKGMPEGTVKLAACNTDANEFGSTLRGRELVFASDTVIFGKDKTDHRSGHSFVNLYATDCNNQGDCSDKVHKVGDKVNSKFHDGPASFTADGRDAVFTRTNFVRRFLADDVQQDAQDVVHLELMVAQQYDSASQEFARIKPFPFNDKKYSNAQPALSPSGNTLVFVSDKPGGEGGSDLYWSKKDASGNWSVPASVGTVINTEGEELFPYMADEKTLYFSSDGHPGIGGLDIYRSDWDEQRGAFSEPHLLGVPFNSSYDDMSPAFYADGASGFLSSNRPAAKGGDNIYYFSRSTLFLDLDIVDENGQAPVAGATVDLEATGDKREMSTGIDGHALSPLYPQSNYTARIRREGYEPQELSFLAAGSRPVDTITRRVLLKPVGGVPYHGIVMDRAARTPLPYADVVVKQLGMSPKTDTLHSDAAGMVNTRLAEGSDYQIFAIKEGMYSEERLVPLKHVRRGAHPAMNDTIFMSRLAVGAVIKIENIYYDYDKANIREDAKPSLERLIDVLKTHPGMAIRINAHTDCRGADAYNRNLSQRRAASVVRWLTENGIGAERMESKGYGESSPIADCKCSDCTEAQHQENRRTEFEILKM